MWSYSWTTVKTVIADMYQAVHGAEKNVDVSDLESFESELDDLASSSRRYHHLTSELIALILTFSLAIVLLHLFTAVFHLRFFVFHQFNLGQ